MKYNPTKQNLLIFPHWSSEFEASIKSNKIRDLFKVKLYIIRSETKKREGEREKREKRERKKREKEGDTLNIY